MRVNVLVLSETCMCLVKAVTVHLIDITDFEVNWV